MSYRVADSASWRRGTDVPIGVLKIFAGIDVRSADINAAGRHVGIRGICPMSFQTSRTSVPPFVGATLTSKPTSASLVSPGSCGDLTTCHVEAVGVERKPIDRELVEPPVVRP